MTKTLKEKPWYKSLTVAGVISGALTFLLSPEVMGVLPDTWAKGLGIASAAASVLGIRRALPPAGDWSPRMAPSNPDEWQYTFNEHGYNPYGETMTDVQRRLDAMDATARTRGKQLLGPHYQPPEH